MQMRIERSLCYILPRTSLVLGLLSTFFVTCMQMRIESSLRYIFPRISLVAAALSHGSEAAVDLFCDAHANEDREKPLLYFSSPPIGRRGALAKS